MDSRLQLTKKQKALVNRLKKTFEELKEENVGIVFDEGEFFQGLYLYFFNKSPEIKETYYGEEVGFGGKGDSGEVLSYGSYKKVEYYSLFDEDENDAAEQPIDSVYYFPSDLPCCDLSNVMKLPSDYWFAVELPRNNESEAYTLEMELSPVYERLSQLKEEMHRYEDALVDLQDTIEHFKDAKVSQEIIDEQMANIPANKKRISELKKEIAALRKEIARKTEAFWAASPYREED